MGMVTYLLYFKIWGMAFQRMLTVPIDEQKATVSIVFDAAFSAIYKYTDNK